MKPNFELLRRAAAIIDGIPDTRIHMETIARNSIDCPVVKTTANSCGSIGCALGWLGLHPEMRAKGLITKTDSKGNFKSISSKRVVYYWQADFDNVGASFFNITKEEAKDLFGENHSITPDKLEFKRRVIHFLNQHNQPVSKAYLIDSGV